MDSDASSSSSSTRKKPRPNCEICDFDKQIVKGRNGVYACATCKQFFKGARINNRVFVCKKDGKCDVKRQRKGACWKCKFDKCQTMLWKREDENPTTPPAPKRKRKEVGETKVAKKRMELKIETKNDRESSSSGPSSSLYYQDPQSLEDPKNEVDWKFDKNVRELEQKKYFLLNKSDEEEYVFIYNRTNVRRTRSLEPPKIRHPEMDGSLRRCFSELDLKDIEDHAWEKLEKVEEPFERHLQHYKRSEIISTMRKFWATVSNNLLFTELPSNDQLKNFKVITSLFSCFEDPTKPEFDTYDNSDRLKKFFPEYGLHCIERIQSLLGIQETRVGTEIMNEQHRLKKRVQEVLVAEIAEMEKEMKLLRELYFRHPLLIDLINTYSHIFFYNQSLAQHLMHLVTGHIFNQYDIYLTLTSGNFWKFGMRCNSVMEQIPQVIKAFLNTEPLKRQLEELREIEPKISEELMRIHVATLSRKAIERTRLPSTILNLKNTYNWLPTEEKDTFSYGDTFDLLHFKNATHTLNAVFKKFMLDCEKAGYDPEDVRAHCSQFQHSRCSQTETLFKGFFNQSDRFYEKLGSLMPRGILDRKMKIFYQDQLLAKLWMLIHKASEIPDLENKFDSAMIISAVISKRDDSWFEWEEEAREHLNKSYSDTLASPYLMLPVSPAHFGLAFVTLEDQLFVSIVKEIPELLEIPGAPVEDTTVALRKVLKKYPNFEKHLISYPPSGPETNTAILCFLHLKTLQLWISLAEPQLEGQKSERALLRSIEKNFLFGEENKSANFVMTDALWKKIEEQKINPLKNNLKKVMEAKCGKQKIVEWLEHADHMSNEEILQKLDDTGPQYTFEDTEYYR